MPHLSGGTIVYQYFDQFHVFDRTLPGVAALEWSVIIPFHNEADWIAGTIASLADQSVPFELILVDNGSTDGSGAIARDAAAKLGVPHRLIVEMRRGKVAALAAGLRQVATRWVATCDADTFYPRDYLATAGALLARNGCVATSAYFLGEGDCAEAKARAYRRLDLSTRVLGRQCHTGGAGQCFDTAVLRQAGGFDPTRWNLVLEDHEIVHRVLRHGRMGHAEGLWCLPAPRERKRRSTRWTLIERIAYHATASWHGEWFFQRFLAPRLQRRALGSEALRVCGAAPDSIRKDFGDAPAYSVFG